MGFTGRHTGLPLQNILHFCRGEPMCSPMFFFGQFFIAVDFCLLGIYGQTHRSAPTRYITFFVGANLCVRPYFFIWSIFYSGWSLFAWDLRADTQVCPYKIYYIFVGANLCVRPCFLLGNFFIAVDFCLLGFAGRHTGLPLQFLSIYL